MRVNVNSIETPEQFRAEAARRMRGFEYTQLALNLNIEAWHCAKPGSGNYSFTITCLWNGMAVTGDITGLLFRVSSFGKNAYGIPFLAHQDKGYVAEKLEEECRTKQFDQPYFMHAVAIEAARRVDAIFPGFDRPDGLDLPAWVDDAHDATCTHEAVIAWLQNAIKLASVSGSQRDELQNLADAMDDANEVMCTHDAYLYLRDTEALGCKDPSDYTLDRLDDEMLQRLYMLEHAAHAILAIKANTPVIKPTEEFPA